MRAMKFFLALFIMMPLHAAELLLLSMNPAADYLDEYNSYQPVKMVRHVLQFYTEPFHIETVSLNRAFTELRKTPGACTPVVRKSAARLHHYLFSQAFIIAPDIRLLVKNDSPWVKRLHRMEDAAGRISLERLLILPNPPVLVTEDGRLYGDKIDQLLAFHRAADSIYVRTAKASKYGDLLPMLLKDFVDMTLEFALALPEEERAKFTEFRLAEAPDYSLAYFACGQDAKSIQVLKLLDQAIMRFRETPEFRELLTAPFPAAEKEQVWQAWLQLNAQPDPPPLPEEESLF
ncbi:hypothetical protein [Rheinheimera texasensis]|uniref:hypothetical protein n=1 Tax=Rheinheimera texasensis TaxID=306205 RepID=UPI0004E0FFF9|nr:hypothetical protein [Rheinheimera texasensis]